MPIMAAMIQRYFLGLRQPFLPLAVEWLWQHRAVMPTMLVVVPTAQSARRLRLALAEKGGCLSPQVVTPGSLMQVEGAATDATELLAWMEVFEGIVDWEPYAAVFPVSPSEGEPDGWAMSLARRLLALRHALQENGLMIRGAAVRAAAEEERWQALADLESLVERKLDGWGYTSRSRALELLADQQTLVAGKSIRHVVLAGVPDFPELTRRRLENFEGEVSVLIGGDAEGDFDALGRPVADWKSRPLAWPEAEKGSVTLCADPVDQARQALQRVAQAGTDSSHLALASADEETGEELVRAFADKGWTLFHPGKQMQDPLRKWLVAWRAYLVRPHAAEVMDLLSLHLTDALIDRRGERAMALARCRQNHLVRHLEDLKIVSRLPKTRDVDDLRLSLETLAVLDQQASEFQARDFMKAMPELLGKIDPEGELSSGVDEWLNHHEALILQRRNNVLFWLDLMIGTMSSPQPVAPEDRVLDVQGWLEIFHDASPHMIVCGLNDGMIPTRSGTDTFLSDSFRKHLGLSHDEGRAARDAYLLQAMMLGRREQGRVDLLLAKNSHAGQVLQPSRLLLQSPSGELPGRVQQLFREIEPPDSSLSWEMEEAWKWKPPVVPPLQRLSVTAFRDYLACPYRFYLKQQLGMSRNEPERTEWSARDFGNMAHFVLENWASDPQAREQENAKEIEEWFHAELDRLIVHRFSAPLPLSIQIQRDALRQRLCWAARVQAEQRQLGWRILKVEEKIEYQLDGCIISGRIDRIEQHEDGRIRVLDYKTGSKLDDVMREHLVQVRSNSNCPSHLEGVDEVHYDSDGKSYRWKNLQIPLYSLALGGVSELGYFTLGTTEAEVKLSMWRDFSVDHVASAGLCARWVLRQIQEQCFWPPAERVTYDDYEPMAVGRGLTETSNPPVK
jgi:ATP-dependent helicase/nuclease subunit B